MNNETGTNMDSTYFTVEQLSRELKMSKEKVLLYCKAIEKQVDNKAYFIRNEKNKRLFSLENLLLIEKIKKNKLQTKGTLLEVTEELLNKRAIKETKKVEPYEYLMIELDEMKMQIQQLVKLNEKLSIEWTLQKDKETALLIKDAQESYPNLFPTHTQKIVAKKTVLKRLHYFFTNK